LHVLKKKRKADLKRNASSLKNINVFGHPEIKHLFPEEYVCLNNRKSNTLSVKNIIVFEQPEIKQFAPEEYKCL
jgi:hypothetical protein